MEALSQDRLNYESYLKINELLMQQKLLSPHHDEMLFIIIHQVFELWFKQIIHEMQEAIRCFEENNIQRAIKVINRIITIQKVLITQIDVLETMTPTEFSVFRDNLRPASGFQSIQFREIELLSGQKNPHILKLFEGLAEARERIEPYMTQPSLYDHFLRLLQRRGFAIDEQVLNRDVSQTYQSSQSVLNAIETIYKDTAKYYDLYMLCEALITYDESFNLWRFRHIKMVERTIGMKQGTGGSPGVKYLATTLETKFFPELWEVRNLIGSY